jgi:hypothetical protein
VEISFSRTGKKSVYTTQKRTEMKKRPREGDRYAAKSERRSMVASSF